MADTTTLRERLKPDTRSLAQGGHSLEYIQGYEDGFENAAEAYQAAHAEASVLVEALEKAREFIETVHEGEYGYSNCTRDELIDQLDAALRSYKEGEGSTGVNASAPTAWMHIQGNHQEPSLRRLDDDEKARGWTEFPLYSTPGVPGLPAFRGYEPDGVQEAMPPEVDRLLSWLEGAPSKDISREDAEAAARWIRANLPGANDIPGRDEFARRAEEIGLPAAANEFARALGVLDTQENRDV